MLTAQEVAEILRVSARTVKRMVDSGELYGLRVGQGQRYRIPREALDAYLRGESRRHQSDERA